ncbi:MAG TPA: GGDEF domain-containing protein [Jatrophihabitantaceae bacterium]
MWSLPSQALAFVFGVEVLAAVLTAAELRYADPTSNDVIRFTLLACLSAIYAETEDRTQRSRRYAAQGKPYVDPTSVWVFAGVLLLPGGYAALLVVVIYAHTLLRAYRNRIWLPHRVAFTGAAMVLSTLAAAAINASLGSLHHPFPAGAATALGIVVALISFPIIDGALVAGVMYLATKPANLKDVVLKPDEFAVELATLVLGAFTAQTVIQTPWLTPAVLVLIVMMYRGLLVKKLEVAATTDGKTGLLNSTAWRELAQRHLWRAVREDQAAAALVIDLDRFKALNDAHGHLVGDLALKTVAECIKHELRDYDAVGRYGGEEFVALLPNAGANVAMRVAERVRARIEDEPITTDDGTTLHLTGSVGVATYPTHGDELDELIRAADTALYAAKDAGRNAVRLAVGTTASATSHQPRSMPA